MLINFHKQTPETLSFISLYSGIYLFHMPAFVLISGYFDKGIPNLKSILQTLLIPYLILQTIFTTFLSIKQTGTPSPNLTTPSYGLWFLLALVHWRILLLMLAQVKNALPIAIIISLLAGCISDIALPLALSKTLYLFPFYLLGHLIAQKRITIPHALTTPKGKLALGLSAATLLILLSIGLLGHHISAETLKNLLWADTPYSVSGVANKTGIIARALLYLTALIVGGTFFLIVPKAKNFLTRIGQNSFAIYVLHFYIVSSLMRYTNRLEAFTGLWKWLAVFVCSLAITWFFALPIFQNLLSYTRRLPLPAASPPPPPPLP
jgi:fucose 4-O-acetylase-like acetyltransferase